MTLSTATPDDHPGASESVRVRLLAEVRAIRRARRQASLKIYAIAATLVLAVALPVWQLANRMPLPQTLSTTMQEVATQFYPLRYNAVPMSHGRIVRMQVPETAMASFGLDASGAGPSDTVMADVVIGEDGLARAVRFVLEQPQEEE
jgi:hypothetical protein